MKKLVINVKRWLHGGKSPSMLRNETGSMCCLGFLVRDCGANVSDIKYTFTPEDANTINWPKGILKKQIYAYYPLNSSLTNRILSVNDATDLSLEEKKSELKKLFRQINYQLIFK